MTRAPYGSIKQVVAAMKLGESKTVLPQNVVAFHNAARRMGIRIATAGSRETGVLRYTVVRIADDWPTAHQVCRLPRRDRITGRWRRDRKRALEKLMACSPEVDRRELTAVILKESGVRNAKRYVKPKKKENPATR